jgi:hypothetical protein
MKKLNFMVSAFAIFCLGVLPSCQKEVVIPNFTVAETNITSVGYTMGGTLAFLYSLDNGDTFTSELPAIPIRSELMVKVNNGADDLTAVNFTFNWSASSITPDSATQDIVIFKVFEEVENISVTVTELKILITSHRSNGLFSSIDETTGNTTPLFTATTGGSDLTDVRGFVYHPNEGKFYMSQTSYNADGVSPRKGYLYTIDTATKASAIINANDGAGGAAIWDAVNNWGVTEDDSLMGYGDFNGDGNGLVKFGTDGGRSQNTLLVNNVCCGLGMLFRAASAEMIVGNSSNSANGEVILDRIDMNTGLVTNVMTTSDLAGFPVDMSLEWLNMKALAQLDGGTIYGILYPYSTQASYFVKIDMAASTVTYISTLGEGKVNQFNMLAYVPKYTL